MDFRIKIDLSSQSIIENTPSKDKKKKNSNKSKRLDDSGIKTPETIKKKKLILKMDKKENTPIQPKEQVIPELNEKPKLNASSVLSLNLPYNENSKTDQAQKLSFITKKKPRHWEKRWVLIPNVFEFTKEIWLKKWVLVDAGDDISDNTVIRIQFLFYIYIFIHLFLTFTNCLLLYQLIYLFIFL